jgi:hypothetical protein
MQKHLADARFKLPCHADVAHNRAADRSGGAAVTDPGIIYAAGRMDRKQTWVTPQRLEDEVLQRATYAWMSILVGRPLIYPPNSGDVSGQAKDIFNFDASEYGSFRR